MILSNQLCLGKQVALPFGKCVNTAYKIVTKRRTSQFLCYIKPCSDDRTVQITEGYGWRERERKKKKERERVYVCVCAFMVSCVVFVFLWMYACVCVRGLRERERERCQEQKEHVLSWVAGTLL